MKIRLLIAVGAVVLAAVGATVAQQQVQPKSTGRTEPLAAPEIKKVPQEELTVSESVGYVRGGRPEDYRAEYKALFAKTLGVLAEDFEAINFADQYSGRIQARQPRGDRKVAVVEIDRRDDGRLALRVQVRQEATEGKPAVRDAELERKILSRLSAPPEDQLTKQPARAPGAFMTEPVPQQRATEAKPEDLTLEQLLDAVEKFREQKAELEKKEKAYMKVVHQKAEKLKQRIDGLDGVTTPPPVINTTGGPPNIPVPGAPPLPAAPMP